MSEPRSKEHQELISSTLASKNTTDSALHDLDRILIAAMATLTVDKERIAVELDVQKDALETLLEYARREVADVEKALAEVWQVTAKYLFSEQAESAATASNTQPSTEEERP